jgi:hypothetical protein
MKWITIFLFILISFKSYSSFKVTVYDDGLACPGNCDAHVVFSPDHNGTHHAFLPSSTNKNPKKCIINEMCTICFSNDKKSCLKTIYRGNGPHKNRFDFTPDFFKKVCSDNNLPNPIRAKCVEITRNSEFLTSKLNCFLNKTSNLCKYIMKKSMNRKALDVPLYKKCKLIGSKEFNKIYSNEMHRTSDCAYSKQSRSLSNGNKYKPLLDGACREDEYVGKYGFDCCSKDTMKSAIDITECGIYFLDN